MHSFPYLRLREVTCHTNIGEHTIMQVRLVEPRVFGRTALEVNMVRFDSMFEGSSLSKGVVLETFTTRRLELPQPVVVSKSVVEAVMFSLDLLSISRGQG